VVAALAVGLVGTSGLEGRGRVLFAVAAFGAVLFAIGEGPVAGLVRQPAVVGLGSLGVLGFASLAWTVGDPAEAALWAAPVLGAAALACAAATVTSRPGGVAFIAATLGTAGAVAAAAGLAGVATRSTPFAECLSGTWRAGGPLEYPPALALVAVSAIPVVVSWMCANRRSLAAVGTLAGALVASAVALSGSRTQIALCASLVALLVWRPGILGGSRRRIISAVTTAAAAGLGCAALARSGLGVAVVGILVALVLGAAVAGRHLLVGRDGARLGACLGALAGAAVLMVGVSAGAPAACGTPPDGGLTHGRIALWQAGAQTALERPLVGAGAATFAIASAERQGDRAFRFAHSQPIELAVELGVLGVVAWLALVGGVAHALHRAWRSRAAALLGPAAVAFPVANLVDWSWHLVGALAVWAVALGGLVGAGCRR
jgi:O-antigen ligase